MATHNISIGYFICLMIVLNFIFSGILIFTWSVIHNKDVTVPHIFKILFSIYFLSFLSHQ